jgi:hypothetical protein
MDMVVFGSRMPAPFFLFVSFKVVTSDFTYSSLTAIILLKRNGAAEIWQTNLASKILLAFMCSVYDQTCRCVGNNTSSEM